MPTIEGDAVKASHPAILTASRNIMGMRILVVGAGATGGYFGGRLAQAGRDVTFLVRPARAEKLRQRGMRITGLGEETTVTPTLVTVSELDGLYDLVLVSVKATSLGASIEDFAGAVGPRTTIIPFLNGMSHVDILSERFGGDAVLGATVQLITTLNEKGDIVRMAPVNVLTIGQPRNPAIAEALDGAGFDFAISPDIRAAMWHKWVFISTLAATNVLMRAPIGDIVAVPGGDMLGVRILGEATAVSAAAGYPVPEKVAATTTAYVTQQGSATTASLYRDLAAGQPTEAEHLFGDLTARARKLHVQTPLLDLATMHLRVYERRRG
jgi:2-dehydropantoate 2-reductase